MGFTCNFNIIILTLLLSRVVQLYIILSMTEQISHFLTTQRWLSFKHQAANTDDPQGCVFFSSPARTVRLWLYSMS